ncbi:hypothetical protein WJX73_004229 [Symbiochloris irregularis]|uniref:Uncharacterized protein n=1 Tax=Symbiochloris irregularis TaxID=706552 RepID=A0AAW1PII3_9CHLO
MCTAAEKGIGNATTAQELQSFHIWRHLTRPQPRESQFPGLYVVNENADRSFKLQVLPQAWRSSPEEMQAQVAQFLHDLEVLLDTQGEPAAIACSNYEASSHILNFVTACKLYRNVPQVSAGQRGIMRQASRLFERWQMLIKAHGLSLMLKDNGWRVPRRVILFSHPDEIFASCAWLFYGQQALHSGFQEMLPQVHDKAAELLHATVSQLDKHQNFLQAEHEPALQALRVHFLRSPCAKCFPYLVAMQVQHLATRCHNLAHANASLKLPELSLNARLHSLSSVGKGYREGLGKPQQQQQQQQRPQLPFHQQQLTSPAAPQLNSQGFVPPRGQSPLGTGSSQGYLQLHASSSAASTPGRRTPPPSLAASATTDVSRERSLALFRQQAQAPMIHSLSHAAEEFVRHIQEFSNSVGLDVRLVTDAAVGLVMQLMRQDKTHPLGRVGVPTWRFTISTSPS